MKRARKYLGLPLLGAWAVLLPGACSKKDTSNDTPVASIDTTPVPVPPVANPSGEPVSSFLDAAVPTTPFEQSQAYEANGQHWLARLVLEPKAFSDTGTKPELNLLAYVCWELEDPKCVDRCAQRLGVKKLTFDGGTPPKAPAVDVGEHQEPNNDAAMARALFLKHKDKEARALLEPKLLDGSATSDEVRLLRAICKDQSDRMCIALCDQKLK